MFPKVSIIVPIYNVEKYLRECVDSLLAQDYPNIELILVDDESPDNCGKICDEYHEKDNNIIVVHKKNGGLGFARNTGLEYVTGEYVMFIDSDDYADKDMISRLMKSVNDNGADTCIGGFKKVDDDKNIIFRETYQPEVYADENVLNVFFTRMLGSVPKKHDAIRMSVWNGLYSMKIIKENNIKFPSERVMISEDIVFDSDYYRYAKKVSVIDSDAYNYRLNVNSLTKSYKANRFELVTDLYLEMEKRVKNIFDDYSDAVSRLQSQYFINLRVCISQEKTKISNKSTKEISDKIISICNNEVVRRVVNNYPLSRLNSKQKIFVFLLKNKLTKLILAVLKFDLI